MRACQASSIPAKCSILLALWLPFWTDPNATPWVPTGSLWRGGRGEGDKLSGFTGCLVELVGKGPDITRCILRDALEAAHGVQVHHSSVDCAVRRAGYASAKQQVPKTAYRLFQRQSVYFSSAV